MVEVQQKRKRKKSFNAWNKPTQPPARRRLYLSNTIKESWKCESGFLCMLLLWETIRNQSCSTILHISWRSFFSLNKKLINHSAEAEYGDHVCRTHRKQLLAFPAGTADSALIVGARRRPLLWTVLIRSVFDLHGHKKKEPTSNVNKWLYRNS